MTEKGMVAVGRVVMGSREHMIAIRPRGKGMIGTTLLYPYEVRKEQSLFDSIPDQKLDREMIGMAHQLMKSKQGHFEPDKFEDRYENAMRELIAKKQQGVTIRASAPAAAGANVVDLMSALRASLNNKDGTPIERRKGDQRRTARAPAKPSRSNARTRKAG
jgi:DNA end-binding protein Ku